MKPLNAIAKVTFLLAALVGAAYIATGRPPSLASRADAAFQRDDYPQALVLYKEYAKTKEVYTNPDLRNRVTMMIVMLEKKVNPPAVANNVVPSMQEASLSRTPEQSSILFDPSTGRERVPHPATKPGELLVMTIPRMGNFEFNPDTDYKIPSDVQALDGAHVRLTGFMIPLTQAEKIDSFALVPTLGSCCYGTPPGVQHIVTCRLPKEKASDFYIDEIVVEGTLHVEVKRESGFTNSIFELKATSAHARE